jgi:hypothetical protein
MRHPLFVDPTTNAAGLPRNILQADGQVTIFDTAVDPQAVWAVTLYVWWHTNGAVPVDPPSLLGRVFNNGEGASTRAVVGVAANVLTALSAAQAPFFAPLKIIDKLCLRGSQILTLQNTVAQGNALVAPYVGDPQSLLVPDGEQESLVIHKLSNTYLDYLTLNVAAAATTDVGTEAKLVLPTGVELLMPFVSGSTNFPYYPVFDGIPMRAPSVADVDIALDLAADGGKQGYMSAYGHFLRD